MKLRKSIFVLFFVITCSSASAQYNTENILYIGPSLGATMSTVNLVPSSVDILYSFRKTEGISARYISEKNLGIQIDLNYFESGWKEQQKNTTQTSYIRNLNFIEVPFLLHAYSASGSSHFFVNMGPEFRYLLSENEKLIDNSTANSYQQHGKLVETPFQYSLVGGLGYEVHLRHSVIGFEGRYSYSLSNLFGDAADDYFSNSNLQTVSLNLYYYFRISGRRK